MNRLKNDLILRNLYVIPPLTYSILVFLSMNTSFECDSNTYFNFAKGNSISLLRGPGYPVFLYLTGMSSSQGSLYFVLLMQWLMGLAITYMILSFIQTNNHLIRFSVSILISSTGYTFYGARLLLAEQLTMFLSLIAILSLLVHIKLGSSRFALFSVFFSSLATLTRYEAVPILLISLLFLVSRYFNNRSFLKTTYIILIPCLTFFGWSLIRSELLTEKAEFGTFANETGTQLMNSLHVAIDNEIIRLRQNGETAKSNEMYYFESKNGDSTRKAKQIAQKHLESNRGAFDGKYLGLSQDKSYSSEIIKIWGPAKANPQVIYDWFFSKNYEKRSPQMILLLNEILVNEIGSKAADNLMVSVSLELIRANPKVALLYLKNTPLWYGIDLNKSNKLYLGNRSLSYWDVPFDPAFCASAVLSAKQFKEYSDFFSKNKAFELVQIIVAATMELFRILFTVTTLLWIGLTLLRKIKFRLDILLILIIHLSIVFFLTLSQVGINSKYTILPGTVSLLAFTLIIESFWNSIPKKKSILL